MNRLRGITKGLHIRPGFGAFFWCLLLCGSTLTHSGFAQSNIGKWTFAEDPIPSVIQVESVFESLPPHGYAPIRVSIENNTDKDENFTISTTNGSNRYGGKIEYGGSFRAKAPKQSVSQHEFVVPIAPNYNPGFSYARSQLEVSIGHRLSSKTFSMQSDTPFEWPMIAMSADLNAVNGSGLTAELKTKASHSSINFEFGSGFNPKMLPADWRAYSGLDEIMITANEWLDLSPGARNSLLQANRFGGRLSIYEAGSETLTSLGIETDESTDVSTGSAALRRGRGFVRLIKSDSASLDAQFTVNDYDRYNLIARQSDYEINYASGWDLQRELGSRSFGSWQVVAILILFGILVGPVNLFVFAKPGQRHRLFFTTPIISVGTSLLLILLILFQDGTGGQGARTAVVNLQPADTAAYITQEQISRTGVLFGGGFEVTDPALAVPVPIDRSPWARLTQTGATQAMDLSMEGSRLDGDWFQSRSEQAQFLQSIRSTRARIEFSSASDGPPEAVSSLPFTLTELHYRDANGNFWRNPGPITTGSKVTLIEGDATKAEALADSLAGHNQEVVQTTANFPGYFVARADPADPNIDQFMIDTLSAINWTINHLILYGPAVVNPNP